MERGCFVAEGIDTPGSGSRTFKRGLSRINVLMPIMTASWLALSEWSMRKEQFDEISSLPLSIGALE